MKLALAIACSTYALVNPPLVFRQGDVHDVPEDTAKRLLDMQDEETGDPVFQTVEDTTGTDTATDTRPVQRTGKQLNLGRRNAEPTPAPETKPAETPGGEGTVEV